MTEPAFIVEGFLEKEFLNQICKGKKIVRLELNGKNVLLDAIVARIETLVRYLNNRYHPIVIVFDREDRVETSSEIAAAVLEKLKARNVAGTFIIGVPDRMIENWILADRAVLKGLKPPASIRKSSLLDGKHGKSLIKQCFADRPYRETMDGVNLLRSARPSAMRVKSESFQDFAKNISFSCPWLRR